jgi:dolichol-phosphate mannosyltransferase
MLALPHWSQILRFLSAGAAGTLLYYITLYTLTEYAHVWYVVSAIIAGVLNYTSNFMLQKLWTFESKQLQGVHKEAGKYATLAGALFVLNVALLYALVEYAHLWYLAAQVIVTIVLTIISFFATRWIFSH